MQELRWILLAVGAIVILGVWVWGRFSAYRAAQADKRAAAEALAAERGYSDAEFTSPGESFGPTIGAEPPFEVDDGYLDTEEMPTVSSADSRHSPMDPPIITLDGLPEDMDYVELSASRPAAPSIPVIEPLRPTPPTLATPVHPPARPTPRPSPPTRNAMPWPPPAAEPTPASVAAAPVEPSAAAPTTPRQGLREPDAVVSPVNPRPVSATPAPTQPPPAANSPEPKSDRLQRIVAVRLVMLSGRLATGEQLAQAFRAEQVEYGRYRIFHRMGAGERPIFSVASLVEPGSFDPDTMATERYLGVSMFAVFPGPVAAPQAFDELVATGRRLAERLGAVLQDDTGQSLSGPRLQTIREELMNFESLATLARSGRRPD